MGTSCTFCSRFCAVTSTSSSVVASSDWAHAAVPGVSAAATKIAKIHECFWLFIVSP